jgi:hypothetical protein
VDRVCYPVRYVLECPGFVGGFWVSGPRARLSGGRGASACVLGSFTRLYVAVRRIGGEGAPARVHMVYSVPAVSFMKRRFRRSEVL